MPTEIGYQDIASLLARQPGVAERWQTRVFSSAGTIQVATFSFGRPIGTFSPQTATYRLASLDNQGIDITGSVTRNPLAASPPRYQAADFPKVARTLKGDRLVIPPPAPAVETSGRADRAPAIEDPATSNALVKGAKTAEAVPSTERAPLDPELQAALNDPPLDMSLSLETKPQGELKAAPKPAAPPRDGFSFKTSSLFFGSSLGSPESIERWQPGEEPVIVMPGAVPDPDMKVMASLPVDADGPVRAGEMGESVAPKGEVNSDNQRAKTPAERLGLFDEKSRAKSEKCLAEAVYFEARGESLEGQLAVARVVMNRAASGKYPPDWGSVVKQPWQFSFVRNGQFPEADRNSDAWRKAEAVAELAAANVVPSVGTDVLWYHADYVSPSWGSRQNEVEQIGAHIFYRS
jgi:hypothetical protein